MNIKKAAFESVIKRLENDLASLNSKIGRNKWDMKKLAEESARMKRERGILCDLMWELRNQAKKVKDGN
uniref:Uncharacterized protein n=1 Tax=viral metagenome TaxID=1070528 RepID=A0A6M3LG68_9ZZZZ